VLLQAWRDLGDWEEAVRTDAIAFFADEARLEPWAFLAGLDAHLVQARIATALQAAACQPSPTQLDFLFTLEGASHDHT
jgi:hypothetical protein